MSEDPKTDSRPELSDFDLVRRACMADISAYEQLVRRYQGRVYGLIYGMIGNREDAEGLMQEVFAKAWKARGNFREQTGFFIWIYRIAINRTINFRKRGRQGKTDSFEEFDPNVKQTESYKKFSSKGSVLRKMSLSEFQKKMNEALLALSEKYRAVVIMHDVQGMSHAEIGAVMNCSEGAVGARLLQAREKVKSQFEVSDLDAATLVGLKAYEHSEPERVEKNIENTLRAVRTAHNKPSLLNFPDKSMGWMFAQPRYGVAALFILFLGLHLLDRPLPGPPSGNTASLILEPSVEMALEGITNQTERSSAEGFFGITPAARFMDENQSSFPIPPE